MYSKSNLNDRKEQKNPIDYNANFKDDVMTKDDLRDLGVDKLVYVHEVVASAAKDLFPEIVDLPEEGSLFAVHAANGLPILLAQDLEAAVIAAIDNELQIQQLN